MCYHSNYGLHNIRRNRGVRLLRFSNRCWHIALLHSFPLVRLGLLKKSGKMKKKNYVCFRDQIPATE